MSRPGQLAIGGGTIGSITSLLSRNLGGPVVDRTGLSGNFDIELRWNPDAPGARTSGSNDTPPLVVAVAEQLGLELQTTSQLMEVIVIDRLDPPTPD